MSSKAAPRKELATVPATLHALDALAVDTLVLFVPADERPWRGAAGLLDWRMCGWLTQQLAQGGITGASGEHVLTWPAGRIAVPRVVLVGVGTVEAFRKAPGAAVAHAAQIVAQLGAQTIAVGSCIPASALTSALAANSELKARTRVLLDDEPAEAT